MVVMMIIIAFVVSDSFFSDSFLVSGLFLFWFTGLHLLTSTLMLIYLCTEGFRYSCRKMEAAAEDKA